jgi:hypothetical protein
MGSLVAPAHLCNIVLHNLGIRSKRMTRRQSDTVQLKLRFPERLRLRIESAADRNQRSMNAEIIHRLEQSFQKDDQAALVEATATAVVDKLLIVSDGKPLVPKGGRKS